MLALSKMTKLHVSIVCTKVSYTILKKDDNFKYFKDYYFRLEMIHSGKTSHFPFLKREAETECKRV